MASASSIAILEGIRAPCVPPGWVSPESSDLEHLTVEAREKRGWRLEDYERIEERRGEMWVAVFGRYILSRGREVAIFFRLHSSRLTYFKPAIDA